VCVRGCVCVYVCECVYLHLTIFPSEVCVSVIMNIPVQFTYVPQYFTMSFLSLSLCVCISCE
jgi:hypothetical protein